MVFKVGKGGVRSGNTLRGLNTTRTKRYARHACLLGYTSLGKRDLGRLIRDGTEEDHPLVGETLAKTNVLLSLNKQQRWLLPAMIGQMIKGGQFNKGAVVSILEKHKLKRRANCVSMISNSTRTPRICPKNNKYFNYSLDSVAVDRSKRQRRRALAQQLKEMKIATSTTDRKKKHVINTYTADGATYTPPVGKPGSSVLNFENDKPEYRMEVFYPCPRSCALTYNPKYTDVSLVEGKEGQMEVKSNVRTQNKKGQTTHRKRFTSRDVARVYCDEINEDVNEMWNDCEYDDNFYNHDVDNNVDDEENNLVSNDSKEFNIETLLARAEKAKDLCVIGRYSSSTPVNRTKKRSKTISTASWLEDEKKSHIVFVSRDAEELGEFSTKQSKAVSDRHSIAEHSQNSFRKLDYFRVILSTSEASPKELKRAYGTNYAEASCQPRRFVIDVTDDVSNLLAVSRTTTKEINFTSYLVFVYDGFYDDGMAAYKVSFNSMISGDMAGVCDVIPFRLTSITEVMNGLVCHLLDLMDKNGLDYVEKNDGDRKERKESEFLETRMKLRVDVFNPSEEISKIAVTKSNVEYDATDDQILSELVSAVDNDSDEVFCDVCYVNVTSSSIDAVSGTRLQACGHWLCDECWASHCRTGIRDGKTVLACGGYDCDAKMGPVTLMSILNVSEVALLLKRQAEADVESSDNAKWCPYPGCGRVIKIDSKSRDLCVDVTCACGNKICFSCMGPAHWPATCDQAEDYLDRLPTLNPAKEYVEEENRPRPFLMNSKNTVPKVVEIKGRLCPRCSKFIEKNGGCPHMFCRCGYAMCWRCMKSWHNGLCTPDYAWVTKFTRTVVVKHAVARKPAALDDAQKPQEPPKINKNKQRASFYQRAMKQREEMADVSKYERYSHVSPLINKIAKATQRDPEFKREVMKVLMESDTKTQKDDIVTALEDVNMWRFNVPSNLKQFISRTVEMKKELHRVREYTYILLQSTPHSVAKQLILKLVNDLNGFCSFVSSILDLQDNQDARSAFRRLVDLQGWAVRALDALIATTRSLRGET